MSSAISVLSYYMGQKGTRNWISGILNDRISGSSQLLEKIMEGLLLIEPGWLEQSMIRTRLMRLDPSMAIISHFLNEWRPGTWQETEIFIKNYREHWSHVTKRLTEQLISNLSGKRSIRIITHSRSGMVKGVLQSMTTRGYHMDIIQTVSLPGGEGRIQFGELSELGINSELISDDLAQVGFDGTEVALLGCDQYNDKGFINKVGTKTILTKFLPQPVYVLTDSRKRTDRLEIGDPLLFEYVPWNIGIRILEG